MNTKHTPHEACGKLVKYFSRQLSCKRKVATQERSAELDGFPRLAHWFRIVRVRKEVMEVGPATPITPEPTRTVHQSRRSRRTCGFTHRNTFIVRA
ncbi:kinase suppressor of Ras 2 isoform X1 [Arapaima gigas]